MIAKKFRKYPKCIKTHWNSRADVKLFEKIDNLARVKHPGTLKTKQ